MVTKGGEEGQVRTLRLKYTTTVYKIDNQQRLQIQYKNSTQYSVITQMGKESEKNICIPESLKLIQHCKSIIRQYKIEKN